MRCFSVKLIISVLALLLSASLAGAADLPRLLVSHREAPGAWGATEISSPLAVGPDGRIYFVTAGPRTTARFGCFDPESQQFEQLADVGALEPAMRVTASIVFDGRGTAWLATHAYQNDAGGQSARILPFSLQDRAFGEPILLEGCSIVDLGLDAKRGQLLVLAAQSLKGRFLRFDLKRKGWKEYDAMLVAGLCRMVMLPDGSAVLVSGNDIYRYNPKKDTLAKSGTLPTAPTSSAGFFGASALVLGSDGKTVYGITRANDLLFSIDGKGGVKNLGPAFNSSPAREQRMALAVADGKLYYAGYEKHQGQVGSFDIKAGKATVGSMASPARVLPPMYSGSACVGRDKRVYLAGFGWTGCGLFAFPPLPEPVPWSTTDRTYECRRIAEGAVTLDGELNDAGWQGLVPLEGFVTAGPNPLPAKAATTGYIAWSDTHLYFAFRCASGGFKAAGKERDDGIWEAECAELFVCPRGADAPYYEIDANPAGVIYDSRVQSYSYLEMEKQYLVWAKSWNGMETKTKVERDANGNITGWTLEAAVPFEAFDGGAPKAGDAWLFNAMRIAMSAEGRGEWSAWHSTNADFHRPHQFPKLKFVQ
ncbi:MAG: carbohydrate-binding family 9-like protein [Armatimonadota bacterium]